ncbi:ABC transporter B family member 1-like [Salvia miltiorrhiza]|uniref:ABC transporter B family member 1-like n=1 Tax=Salvia miltiorrhiza TaxID=226208 RepID=UPI0025AC8970|nr:ABC transporter B family member 1-like [Salvia miltiorrhiza]
MRQEDGDEEEIKTVQEQWRWSELQGVELVVSSHSDTSPPPNLNNSYASSSAANPNPPSMEPHGGGEPKKIGSPPPSVAFRELFRFADRLDYALMTIGTVGAIVHGSSLPLFLRFFADLVNFFGSNADNVDKMSQEVLKYAFYFLVVGAAIWASSWAEISCWMWSGERQSTKMRIEYLEAALNQDIQFFDTEVRTSDVVFAINTDAVMVQDAISEKLGNFLLNFVLHQLGNFLHYMATFLSGFVVGFSAVWQLALVTLAVVPLIVVIGAIHTITLAMFSSKSQEALSQAGNIDKGGESEDGCDVVRGNEEKGFERGVARAPNVDGITGGWEPHLLQVLHSLNSGFLLLSLDFLLLESIHNR